jgi:sulfotransferase family protein
MLCGMPATIHQSLPQAEPEPVTAPKVLYIAGMTRSGTTLLCNLLNEIPGFVGVGELRTYWRAMRETRQCACGATVPECAFWSEVAGWIERHGGPPPIERALFLQRAHIRSLPLQLARLGRAKKSAHSPGAEYAQLLAQLYAGIGAVSGADVVVDSSKGPHDAYVISKFTELDLFVIHLVRDPRGVAYSSSRRVPIADKPTGYMDQHHASEAAIRWVTRNALTEILLRRRLGPRYMRVRYEDFVRHPDDTIAQISAMCAAGRLPLPALGDEVSLARNHMVAGNPRRHAKGPVRIRPDREWTERMARPSMLAATIGAAPLLRHYGYQLRPTPH